MTTDTKSTTETAEKAAQALHKKYTDAGDIKSAKIVATVANLFTNLKLPAKEDKTAPVDSAEIDGQAVDLGGMTTTEAQEYQAYAKEMDGSAARERHIKRLEDEDAEMAEIHGRMHDGS
jgi:hypothetical protein